MAKKKKCKCKKKCNECAERGSYYLTGEVTKKQLEMICEMTARGINVYHLFGKPGGCPNGVCE